MASPESRRPIRASGPGVDRRGNRYVAVVRTNGKEKRILSSPAAHPTCLIETEMIRADPAR